MKSIHFISIEPTTTPIRSGSAKVSETKYYPYGVTQEGGSDKYLYTGKELDRGTGLYYYEARYYNPNVGRFVQPDTLIPDVYNPQALNRYSYVLNNPMRYTDPNGEFAITGAFLVAAAAVIVETTLFSLDMYWTAKAIHEQYEVLANPESTPAEVDLAYRKIVVTSMLESIDIPGLPTDDLIFRPIAFWYLESKAKETVKDIILDKSQCLGVQCTSPDSTSNLEDITSEINPGTKEKSKYEVTDCDWEDGSCDFSVTPQHTASHHKTSPSVSSVLDIGGQTIQYTNYPYWTEAHSRTTTVSKGAAWYSYTSGGRTYYSTYQSRWRGHKPCQPNC